MIVKYIFEWHDEKNESNFEKHGIWFEEAKTVWADRHSLEVFDPEHSDDEDRFLRLGYSTRLRLLLIVFCQRDSENRIRIISARKATKREREEYEEGI